MRRRMDRYARRGVTYGSEAALCEVLRSFALASGWSPYPETSGWDLLLVRERDGFQVGVQAKKVPNVDVLSQTLVGDRAAGPDVHAVLVPSCSQAFRDVARALNVLVLEGCVLDAEHREHWRLPLDLDEVVQRAPHRVHLPGRCWVPPFMPNLPAGVPGPRQVTPWKVGMAKLCAGIRNGDTITNRQVRALRLDFHELEAVEDGRRTIYRVPASVRLPDVDFPEVSLGLGLPLPPGCLTPAPALASSR